MMRLLTPVNEAAVESGVRAELVRQIAPWCGGHRCRSKYAGRSDAISHSAAAKRTLESAMTRYRLDPVFDRMPDGAVNGIIRYDIYLDGHFVGSRRTHGLCHDYLDELMPSIPEPGRNTATIHELRRCVDRYERRDRDAGRTRRMITGNPGQ
jgi:hypothetical protein